VILGKYLEQQGELGVLDYIKATPEVAKTLLMSPVGAAGFAGGFVEGVYEELKSGQFGTPEAGKRIEESALKKSMGSMARFMPESEAGLAMLEGLGELTEDIPPLVPLAVEANVISQAARAAAPMLKSKLGGNVVLIDQNTGLPTKPLAKALNKRDVKYSLILDDPGSLPELSRKKDIDAIVNSIIEKRIKQGSGNESLAGLRIKGSSIITDTEGVETVRQGFRPGDVASAKNTNRETKERMLEMLNIKRRIQGDSSVALEVRPSKMAGDELMNRFEFVRDKASKLRDDLNVIAEGEPSPGALPGPGVKQRLKGLQIDTSAIENAVLDGLEKININIPEDVMRDTVRLKDFLKSKDAFSGSDISKDGISKKLIRDTIDLLSEPGDADALRAHRIKRQIDTTVDFRRKLSGGLTDSGENFAKSIRTALNDSVREVHPEYAKVNDELSRALNTMNKFRDVLPKKVDFFGDNIEEAVGQEMRKLLSNYSVRQELGNSIKSLDDTAKFFGADFRGDVNKLVQFNNTLDDRFGATARGSFKAEIESATRTKLSTLCKLY
jgi:hypothetical protein